MIFESYDGTKIFYTKFRCSKPKGTIVLLHGGFHGNYTLLNGMISRLNKNYTVVAPDLRGRGDSDFPDEVDEVKLEDYARDIYELCLHEKITKPFVIGVSFGGIVTLKFSELYKDLNIRKIALVSSTNNLKGIRRRAKVFSVFYNGIANLTSKIAEPWPERRKMHVDYSDSCGRLFSLKYGIKLVKNNSVKTTLMRQKMMKAAMTYRVEPKALRKIGTEMLIIHGQRDGFFPLRHLKELKENTNSTIKIIKKGTHNIYISHAAQVSRMINEFFGR